MKKIDFSFDMFGTFYLICVVYTTRVNDCLITRVMLPLPTTADQNYFYTAPRDRFNATALYFSKIYLFIAHCYFTTKVVLQVIIYYQCKQS